MSIAVLIEAAEFLERRERGEKRLFILHFLSGFSPPGPPEKKKRSSLDMPPMFIFSLSRILAPSPPQNLTPSSREKSEKGEKNKTNMALL